MALVFTEIPTDSPGVEVTPYVTTQPEYDARCQSQDLTPEELDYCCQGSCGIRIFNAKIVPDFIFRECCCRHDFGYLRRGSSWVKAIVDDTFHREMHEAIENHMHPMKVATRTDENVEERGYLNTMWVNFYTLTPVLEENWYRLWARLYAHAVVRFGWLAWHDGPMRNKEEILAAAGWKRNFPLA